MTVQRLSRASKEDLLALIDETPSEDIPSGKLHTRIDVWVTKGWAERLELPRGGSGWRITPQERVIARGQLH